MKLRVNQLSIAPPYVDLPGDLTGYAVTLDLSHSDAAPRSHPRRIDQRDPQSRSLTRRHHRLTARTPGHPQQRRLKDPGGLNAERAPNSR